MNSVRVSVGNLFGSPIQNMNYISYMEYVNTDGKITARSLMDLVTILLTHAEEQEKKNEKFEADFKEIEAILAKLVDKKLDNKVDVPTQDKTKHIYVNEVKLNTEGFKVDPKHIQRTPEDQIAYEKKVANLAKAREARKTKQISSTAS